MISVIMPMAGLGSRFAAAGETCPKPAIPVAGIPMFRLALGAIQAELPDAQVICAVLAEHKGQAAFSNLLSEAEPGARIAVVPHITGGALETCLAAVPFIANIDAPVIVLDCDLTFVSAPYFESLRAMEAGLNDAAGLLLSFRSREKRYSFAEVDGDRVLRTCEKQPVSDRALIGAYGFRSARMLFDTAREIVCSNERTGNGEFYVSSAYNRLLAGGHTVRIVDAEFYWSMGTPQELADCLASPEFLQHVEKLRAVLSGTAL